MKKEPVDDLRLLFLRLIAEETPNAATVLFSLRDAGEWMEHYGVSADWPETHRSPRRRRHTLEFERSGAVRGVARASNARTSRRPTQGRGAKLSANSR
jgi:hypothetical protein